MPGWVERACIDYPDLYPYARPCESAAAPADDCFDPASGRRPAWPFPRWWRWFWKSFPRLGGVLTKPPVFSGGPVRYGNSEVGLLHTDLSAPGFGQPFGHSRSFANKFQADLDVGYGYNWLINDLPMMMPAGTNAVVVIVGANAHYWFDFDGANYTARFHLPHTLTYDSANSRFVFVTPEGNTYKFHDFTQTTYPIGLLHSHTAPTGQVLSATSYANDRITEVQRQVTIGGTTTIESFLYTFHTSGTQNGRLQTVLWRRKVGAGSWTDLRRGQYVYYEDSVNFGSLGDLKTATIQQWSGSAWQDLGTYYFRYYTSGESNGFVHGLKFALTPEAFDRLSDAGDPYTATDTTVSAYAEFYYEYNSSRRVNKERTKGAVCGAAQHGETTYEWGTNNSSGGYNDVFSRMIETRPDGSQFYVYCNKAGMVLLIDMRSGDDRWRWHFQYDTRGNVTRVAHPSAVVSFDEDQADLAVVLRTSAGRIDVITYYTTDGSGAAKDYCEYIKTQQGTAGSLINLYKLEYTSQTVGSNKVVFPSKLIPYKNDDGTGALETQHAYTFHSGTFQIEQGTTTHPAVPTTQNGSGSATSAVERFDALGYPSWSKDERGVLARRQFDWVTGAETQRINDVDTSQTTDEPSGWSTVSGFGLHAVTDMEVEAFGRTTMTRGPVIAVDDAGTSKNVRPASYMVYKDPEHEVWQAQGEASGTDFNTHKLANPVSIAKLDFAGRVIEQIAATRASTSGKLVPTDSFARSSYVRWSTDNYTDHCQRDRQRVYHTIPSSGDGSSGTNYDQTDFGFDAMGRQNKTKSPGGTITRTVFDVRGLPIKVFVGTNDTGATDADPTGGGATGNNMVQTEGFEYDGNADQGDGQRSKHTAKVDGNSSNDRVTLFINDFRGRRTAIDGESDFYQKSYFDNLDNEIKTERYNTTAGGTLIGRSERLIDDRGRVYRTKQYAVNVSTGTVGNALEDNIWFDAAGNVIKQKPSGGQSFNKFVWDGLNRETRRFLCFGSDTTYADASSVTNNTVAEQTETAYDLASNVIQTTLRRRFHNATGTGELTSPGGAQPKARVSYVALYPDAIGREQARADYGTNGGSSFTRSATIPTRSDDVLVHSTEYNNDGEAWKTIDPASRDDRETYDDAGRRSERVENWKASPSGSDENVTTRWAYTPDGNTKTFTAVNSTTGDQVTKYAYGATLSDSGVARSDFLRAEIYPDSDDVDSPLGNGADGIYDRIEYEYNRQGEMTKKKDQNETVHAYDTDKLARQTHDRITTLGSGIDGAVRRISTTYEVRGLVEKVTSYDNATVGSGSIVNEIQNVLNDFGQTTSDYQSHSGAVVTGTTPRVQYAYADGSNNHIRQTSLTYPNGRVITYDFGSSGSIDDVLSRVRAIKDGTLELAAYSFLGAGFFVQVDYTEPDIRYDLATGGGSDPYDGGLDRFERIIDLRWINYATSTDVERLKYGYDRADNRLWMERLADSNRFHDELYSYDGINRLKTFTRGTINTGHTAITTLKFAQEWGLDPTGNWSSFKEDSNGDATWDLVQTRASNKVNEITDISETTGPSWATPAYNKPGGMTTIPKPLAPTGSFAGLWDSWERLVKVSDGANTVAEFALDGVHRRVITKSYAGGVLSETRHHYLTADWQHVEERLGSSTSADRQWVFGNRYIDDLILRDRDTNSDGTLDERLYSLQGPTWNMLALANAAGAVQERYRYAAYGDSYALTSAYADRGSSLYAWEIRLAGYRQDIATSLYTVRFRVQHFSLGVWHSRDPMADESGRNLYEYVTSRPTVLTDALGLQPNPAIQQVFADLATCLNNAKKRFDDCTDRATRITGISTFVEFVYVLKNMPQYNFCSTRWLIRYLPNVAVYQVMVFANLYEACMLSYASAEACCYIRATEEMLRAGGRIVPPRTITQRLVCLGNELWP